MIIIETTFFGWVWPIVLSSNQIAGFYDHQFVWKESNFLVFLQGDNHQGKIASEAATLGWVWPVAPLTQRDCRNL